MAEGKKFDQEKADLSIISPYFKTALAQVMMYGAKKYGKWNYAQGIDFTRYLSAAERHLDAITRGEDIDPESGLPHWAHVSANMLMLSENIRMHGKKFDNRFDGFNNNLTNKKENLK